MGRSKKNKKKSEMNAMFFIILLALVIFIISTYAWFSTQRNVSITNLNGIVEVAEGLEISLDAQNWSNGIVLGDEVGQLDIIEDAYLDNKNISPTEMLPVSTLGLSTLPASQGEPTRLTDLQMLRGTISNSIQLSNIVATDNEMTNSDDPTYPGYFAFDVFLKNSSRQDVLVDELQLNYDSSLQILAQSDENEEEESSDPSSTGLQNTARVAFAKYEGTADVMADQATILNQTAGIGAGASTVYIDDVAIWEPNANDHVEYIVQNNNKITWSGQDQGTYGSSFTTTTKMPTYALTSSSLGHSIANIYKWDGTEQYLEKQNTLQTTKTSPEDYTINEGVQNLVSTSDGTTKFTIAANAISRIRIYVWLEGQDVDCINYASYGGGITVNIGLVKGSVEGSKEPTLGD